MEIAADLYQQKSIARNLSTSSILSLQRTYQSVIFLSRNRPILDADRLYGLRKGLKFRTLTLSIGLVLRLA